MIATRFRARRAALVVLLPAASFAQAQLDWADLSPMSGPKAEDTVRLVYVDATKRVLLFGGYANGGTTYVGDTLEWNGAAWTKLSPATSPSPRVGHGLAYDILRNRVVLFGGRDGGGSLRETWEWDGTTWQQKAPVQQPSAEDNANMVYDSLRGRVVLFGGFRAGQTVYLDETWEYDGAIWLQVQTQNKPRARVDHAMAFDSARGRVVMYGGWNNGGFQDTWEYDGTDWKNVTPGSMPQALDNAELAYDAGRCRTVLFGGGLGSTALDQTWEWDGLAWTQAVPATKPGARVDHAMAFDKERGRIVLYGGYSPSAQYTDTWEHVCAECSGGNAARRIGKGVASGTGESLVCTSRPLLAGSLDLRFGSGFAGRQGAVILSAAALAAPVTLGGAEFCVPSVLHVDPVQGLVVALPFGVVTASLPIPNDPTLLCQVAFAQGVALSASPRCLLLSDALEARVIR